MKLPALIASIIIATAAANSFSQSPLGLPLNGPLTSEYSPSISANGRVMLLEATTGENDEPEFVISTQKGGVWSRPEAVPGVNSAANKLNYTGAAFISYDGNSIFFASNRYGGIGNSDIWYMERAGNTWTAPKNLAKPVNSLSYDGDPCISADGKYLYFARCSSKAAGGENCCKIMVSEKVGKDGWKEPKELPAPVNMGCEAAPRILPDGKTLLFSSIRAKGKGGYDLYESKMKDDGTWAEPVALDFINTSKDDSYATVPASGDIIYYTGPAKLGTDIYRNRIPDALQGEKIILLQGIVKNGESQQPLPARTVIYSKKGLALNNTASDGSYTTILAKGDKYDFSISANDKGYTFYSDFFNLDTLTKYKFTQQDVKLLPLKANVSFVLKNLTFDPNSAKISQSSSYEMERLVRLLKDNVYIKAEIAAYTDEVKKDSVATAELTEEVADTLITRDTLNNEVKVIKKFYTNDRTQKEAEAVVNYLALKGIPKSRLTPKGYGSAKPLAPNTNDANRLLNRRVEFKVISN